MTTNPSAAKPDISELPPRVDPESLVRGAMDDIALIVGGAAALHQLDDDLVWTVMKRLDRARVRLLRDLKGATSRSQWEPACAKPPRVHAAVEEFLVRNGAETDE
jgi:hypothetical protein